MVNLMDIEQHYIDVTIHRIHSNCDSILVQVVNLYKEEEEKKKKSKVKRDANTTLHSKRRLT
jgi:hypothetical protein